MVDKQNFIAQFVQPLKRWLCDTWWGVVTEKSSTLSVDHCRLQTRQFWVHLTDLLSILLRCNGFTGIQKAVVDQTMSRPQKSDHDLFFWCKFGSLRRALELLLGLNTELVISSCINSTFCLMSQSDQEMVHCC